MGLLIGWPEEVFNQSKGGEHEPLGPDALVEALAYVIANPPAAFAVRYARDWPDVSYAMAPGRARGWGRVRGAKGSNRFLGINCPIS